VLCETIESRLAENSL